MSVRDLNHKNSISSNSHIDPFGLEVHIHLSLKHGARMLHLTEVLLENYCCSFGSHNFCPDSNIFMGLP